MQAVTMPSVASQRTAFAGQSVRQTKGRAVTQRVRCAAVASADKQESRRQVLGGLVAGLAALTFANNANAIDILDDRKARNKGFDLIYEARDLDLDQATRDGLTQARTSLESTKKRVKESESRFDTTVGEYVDKSYWTLAREELRNQLGTLRFDLNTLANQKPKSEKKQAIVASKEFFRQADDVDFAIRKKDLAKAQKAYADAKAGLDKALSYVL